MKILKSLEDVEAAGLSPPIREVAEHVVRNLIAAYAEYGETYNADDYGYTVVIEEGDTEDDVRRLTGGGTEFPPVLTGAYGLRDALFEGVVYEGGCFLTCTLHNNEYGISWIVPDAPWLDSELRAKLADECGDQVPSR